MQKKKDVILIIIYSGMWQKQQCQTVQPNSSTDSFHPNEIHVHIPTFAFFIRIQKQLCIHDERE